MRRSSRAAFSLIEVLVVIAVIGILLALLLPAVMRARESARRAQCLNNMSQLGLALQNYHDTHSLFPLNYGNGHFNGTNTGVSWMQMVLPQLDQGNLYSRILFGQPIDDPTNRGIAMTVVPEFLCPSSSNSPLMEGRSNVAGPLAVTNYKACCGSNWDWGTFSPLVSTAGRNAKDPNGLDHCNGLICRAGAAPPTNTSLRDVTDGASSTIALGETVPLWCAHAWWYWFNGSLGTAAIPPNYSMQPDVTQDAWHNNYSFQSQHTGGVNVAFVDGSGRFLSDSIDEGVYRALGTIQGGEIVGDY